MKQRIGIIAAVIALGLGLGQGLLSARPQRMNGSSSAAGSVQRQTIHTSPSSTILQGVLAPLNSLRLMKRAIATSTEGSTSTIPLLAILNEPLKTTGLGPIQIGMSVAELEDTGLDLAAIDGSDRGECSYYRIRGNTEPIGLMVINDRILRIDVWPGSLIETLSGAKIGSTEADLVRLYGDQLEAVPNPVTLGKTVVFKPRDPGEDLFRLVFETDDRGQVVQYRAGQFPSVTWPEGCL